jgi:hypothetical protein
MYAVAQPRDHAGVQGLSSTTFLRAVMIPQPLADQYGGPNP